MGHKGKHGAVRVCPRGFRMSPSTSLIASPCSYHISALPAEGESPYSYHLWCPEDPRAQFVITVGTSHSAATCRPQLTVIYKIVLIPPNFLWFSLLTSVAITSCKCTLADMAELHMLQHKNVMHLSTQLCWRWTGWPRRGHYWGLGQRLCAAFRSHGEITGSSCRRSEQPARSPDAHSRNLQKIPSSDFHYQTYVL